jgi:hypothetical protein
VAVNDDELSSELKGVLAERGQPEGATAHVEAAVLAAVAPVQPEKTVMGKLMDRVRAEDRITWFAPQLAQLYDLSLDDALKVIAQIHDVDAWEAGPAPGVKLMPVKCGPKVGEALAALVWLDPKAEFPEHPHLGLEQVLVIEGGYLDSSGVEFWRGELHVSQGGTHHSFGAVGGIPCICAALHAISHPDP